MTPERTRTKMWMAVAAVMMTALLLLFLFIAIGVRTRGFVYNDSKVLAGEISLKEANETRLYITSALSAAYALADKAKIYKQLGGKRENILQMLQEALKEPDFMGAWTMWEPNAFDGKDQFFSRDSLFDSEGTMSIAYFKFRDSVFYERNERGDFKEDFYTEPRRTEKDLILEPFHYQYHGHSQVFYQTSAVVPVMDEGKFLGVFGIDINLDSLQARFSRIRLYNTGFLSLISGTGIIISHPDTSLIDRNFFSIVNAPERYKYNDLGLNHELAIETVSERSHERVFRFFYPVSVGKGAKPWYIMAEIPIRQAAVRSHQLLIIAYVTLALGLILLFYLIINISDRRRYKSEILASMQKVEESNRIITENETRFRTIFENANDAILIMNGMYFTDCNLISGKMFGCSKEELVHKTPLDFSPAYQPGGISSAELAEEKIDLALQGQPQRFEWQHKRLDGSLFDAEVSLNRLVFPETTIVQAIVRDITERKRAEAALHESEKNFRNIFDKTNHGIIILSMEGRILAANRAFTEISGYVLTPDNPLYVADIIIPEQLDILQKRIAGRYSHESLSTFEYKARYKDGKIHIIEADGSMMDFNSNESILVIMRDVTEIRESEQRIMEAIIQTEETERSRIAQDLHDGLGPVLSTIKLYFQVYKDATDPVKREFLTDKLKSTIDEAIKSVSEISRNLSPHVLRNYGFYAAVKQFVHQIEQANLVKFAVDFGNEPAMNGNTSIFLYRAVSELINNSLKHAKCSHIRITVLQEKATILLEYGDDGTGYDPDAVLSNPASGSGLQNIINRIAALNGEVSFRRNPGQGMTTLLKIPI